MTGGTVAFVLGLCALSFALGCVVTAYMLRRPEPAVDQDESEGRDPGEPPFEPAPEQDRVVTLRARTLVARLAEHEAAAKLVEQDAEEDRAAAVVELLAQGAPRQAPPTLPSQPEKAEAEQPKTAG